MASTSKASSLQESGAAMLLLSRAHTPDTASRIFTDKVKTRPLFLKPNEHDNAQEQRRRERQRKLSSRMKKLKPKPLSSRERRALGLYEVPKEEQKYCIYEPLNHMWQGYMQEVLGDKCMPVGSGTAAKLCSADYHGAELEVVRSRCVGRVGAKGIVIKDSKFAFEVITKSNKILILPKEHTTFRFTIPKPGSLEEGSVAGQTPVPTKPLVFELHGDQFILRAVDRANRKFKPHFLTDL